MVQEREVPHFFKEAILPGRSLKISLLPLRTYPQKAVFPPKGTAPCQGQDLRRLFCANFLKGKAL
jgi:hypothetical protein